MTPPHALERALSRIDVSPGHAWRQCLSAGDRLTLARGDAALVYLVAGELTGRASQRSACAVDAPSGAAAAIAGDRTLLAGDAVVALGCHGLTLTSQSGAEVTVVPLALTPTSDTRALPPVVFVSDFARAEPAAAGLAAHLGIPAPEAEGPRGGDGTICKLMVTTVLLSALRAWAASAHEQAWPPRTDDPFLARVVSAVIDDPGREWSIDQLAALGAMSRSVFAARFRQVFGTSPAGYVTDVRMAEAKRLLDAGAAVSEVSRTLGYGSDEGFRRAFRRHVGVAPSAWRAGRRELTA